MELVDFPYVLECVLGIIAGALIYYLAYSPFNYWKSRGVPQVKVQYPFVGNTLSSIFKPLHEVVQDAYYSFPDERFVGTYQFRTPALLIRDPELVESILIKDFSHVGNRGNADDPNNGILSKNLLNLEGDRWKSLRNKLTPTFSPGKLKGMHSQLIECADSLIKYMNHLDDRQPFEATDVVSRFTMDVIAYCAFGLNIDTINDPDNMFRKLGLAIFKPSLKSKIMFLLRKIRPFLKKIGIYSSSKKYEDFFVNAVDSALENRKKNNIQRHDFLHLMNELRLKDQQQINSNQLNSNDQHIFDHSTLISNAFVFFLAGFETTASTISYALYELALNQGLQNRLFEEVSTIMEKYDGVPTFEAVQEMTLLDNVISETLRKYPPAVSISRKITKEYRLPGTDLVLPLESIVILPMYGLHHDPQYFPEPSVFRPERFDEEQFTIRKGSYLPFGDGPRICIGARFAKNEAKVCLSKLMKNFKVIKCNKTKVPLTYDRNAFLLVPEGGIWLAFERRTGSNDAN